MRVRAHILVLAGLSLTTCLPNDSSTSAAEFSAATKRALLIGIDDYKAPHVSDLRGCGNDVDLMSGILVDEFGFERENVRVLKDVDATHEGIIAAIESDLIDKAGPDDIVVLHYSGHGSRMKDASGDETDGYDETLVPHDSRIGDVFDISDDQVNGLLKRLTDKTKNVTFIFDSCHSGSATRAGNVTRLIPSDERPPPPPVDYAIGTRGAGEGDADFRLNDSDYVLISGCLATELSNEARFEDRRHGAMTWFLARALRAAGDRSTYRSVMDKVRNEVSNRYSSQHPQLEGPGMDLRVFGTERIKAERYLLVQPENATTVKVDGGEVHGLRRDAILQIYPPETDDFLETDPVAKVQISDAGDFSSTATLVEGGPVEAHSRALIEASLFGGSTLPIYVATDGSEVLSSVKTKLGDLPALDFAATESDARVIVAAGDDGIQIMGGDLEPFMPAIPPTHAEPVDAVVDGVKQVANWLNALDLANPGSTIKLGFSLRRKGDPVGAPAPAEAAPGSSLTFRIENLDEVPLFVYLLDISSDGSVGPIYPRVRGAHEELQPNGVVEKNIKLFLPDSMRSTVDVFKVIATTQPINTAPLLQGPFRTRAAALEEEPKTWVTAEQTVTIRQPAARFSGFAVHYDTAQAEEDVPVGTDVSRGRGRFERRGADGGTLWELIQLEATRGETRELLSVGEIFDEAYEIQEEHPDAVRVEPLLDVEMPGVVDDRGIDKRGIGSKEHDQAAREDDEWHLKQIRAADAWKKVREKRGVGEGAEASDVLVAHIDTGYREHPENWDDTAGVRPIDAASGNDYLDGDNPPVDELLAGLPLDNPAHGTASGSIIVSPLGCQLKEDPDGNEPEGCVNGVAPGAQLVPLRVHRSVSQINTSNLSRAIREVANGEAGGGAKMISIAMGGPPTLTMWKAVRAAERNGVLVIAAAGNYVRTVVWPARFRSTIAAAAVNVRCQPWKHTSRGRKVDISAPGESVWRATLNKDREYINAMGKGTTFATGNTAGAAALWLAYHGDDLDPLRQSGELTRAFKAALAKSAWQPAGDASADPPGTHCIAGDWKPNEYGAGILDVSALLDVPLEGDGTRAAPREELPDLPLFSSLYPDDAQPEQIRADYNSLFAGGARSDGLGVEVFETEILYHYTVDEDVQRSVELMVGGQRGNEPADRVKRALGTRDLSDRLRQALAE